MKHYADASFLVALLNPLASLPDAAPLHYREQEAQDWLVSAWAELESIHAPIIEHPPFKAPR